MTRSTEATSGGRFLTLPVRVFKTDRSVLKIGIQYSKLNEFGPTWRKLAVNEGNTRMAGSTIPARPPLIEIASPREEKA
jgi:hypothetical protein